MKFSKLIFSNDPFCIFYFPGDGLQTFFPRFPLVPQEHYWLSLILSFVLFLNPVVFQELYMGGLSLVEIQETMIYTKYLDFSKG